MNEKTGDINLIATSAALDHFYLSTRLEFSLRIWMQANITNLFRDDQALASDLEAIEAKIAELLQVIRGVGKPDDPMLMIYEKAIVLVKSWKTGNDPLVEDFHDLLDKYQHYLPVERLKDFFSVLRSYLAFRYNSSKDLIYLKKLHECHVAHREKGYLTIRIGDSGYILQSELQNVINTALKLDNPDWALQFLQDIPAERIIGPSQPDIIWSINLANIFFQKREFQHAKKIINRALKDYKGFKFIDDQHYRLLTIRLYTKILYELDCLDDEEGLKFCKTAKEWIRRDKDIKTERRETHSSFFSITITLFDAKRDVALQLPAAKIKYRKARKDLEETPRPAEYEWLVDKMTALQQAVV